MSILTVLTAPDSRLNITAKHVEKVTDEIRLIFHDMLETMYDQDALGLAATQVGIALRLIVVDIAYRTEDDRQPLCMANPEIIWTSETEDKFSEGCLSVPDQRLDVTRPACVRVTYLDENGIAHEKEFDAWWGRCIQHEIDHLNGILIIDHVSKLKRQLVLKKLKKLKQS